MLSYDDMCDIADAAQEQIGHPVAIRNSDILAGHLEVNISGVRVGPRNRPMHNIMIRSEPDRPHDDIVTDIVEFYNGLTDPRAVWEYYDNGKEPST